MKKKKKTNTPKGKKKHQCPLCLIMDTFKGKIDEYDDIIDHFSKAKKEVLEGFKKIIDREMDSLKKKKKDFSKVDID